MGGPGQGHGWHYFHAAHQRWRRCSGRDQQLHGDGCGGDRALSIQRMNVSISELSRRRFARLAGTAALAGPRLAGQPVPLTAQEVIDRIQKNSGIPWQPQTLDTFKAGDPSTLVKGIATTAMATMDVLKRASQGNFNLIVTL